VDRTSAFEGTVILSERVREGVAGPPCFGAWPTERACLIPSGDPSTRPSDDLAQGDIYRSDSGSASAATPAIPCLSAFDRTQCPVVQRIAHLPSSETQPSSDRSPGHFAMAFPTPQKSTRDYGATSGVPGSPLCRFRFPATRRTAHNDEPGSLGHTHSVQAVEFTKQAVGVQSAWSQFLLPPSSDHADCATLGRRLGTNGVPEGRRQQIPTSASETESEYENRRPKGRRRWVWAGSSARTGTARSRGGSDRAPGGC
jgi:hypothetical protein